MEFLIRQPVFPAIIDTGVELVGVRSWKECVSRFDGFASADAEEKPVVDAEAEGFVFYPNIAVISPFTVKKNWTKAEIIALYNTRKKPAAAPYHLRSLSSRTVARIVAELVELLNEP